MVDVTILKWPPKRKSLQKFGTTTENFRQIDKGYGLVPFLNDSQITQSETLGTNLCTTESFNGNGIIHPLTITTRQIEKLVID